MNKLIQYFSPKGEMNFYDTRKTNAFILLSLLGLVVVSFVIVQNIIFKNENYLVSTVSSALLGLFIIIGLFIIRNFGVKLAGNIFSFGLVFLMAVVLNILNPKIPAMFKYLQGFYSILGIFCIGVLFASRTILIINAAIIVISTTRVFLFAINQSPEQTELLKAGFINHTITLVIIGMIIYFTNLYSERALEIEIKTADLQQKQNKRLSEILGLVQDTVNVLDQLSKSIGESAGSLSSSSNEQAANVEEISSTLEEMSASIIQNADETEFAANTVDKTTQNVQKSQLAINKTLNAIQEINQKIELIQEIAKKTNLLALNASIEAARAGDAGKAENSSQGAKDIEHLVKTTILVSNEAGNLHSGISTDIGGIDNVIKKISISSAEIKNSVEHINRAIFQINEGAQNNALISENLVNSIEQLTVFAEKLYKLIEEGNQNS